MNEKNNSEGDKYDKIFEAVLSTPESEFYANAEKILSSKTERMKKQHTFDSKNLKTISQPKKRRKETIKDRLLEWNNFYSKNKFGIWIQCTECNKWRKEMEYEEDHEVPSNWSCSMSSSTSVIKSCDDPEDTKEPFSPVDFIPGSIVWAKLEGYPWWPGMVEDDPDTEEYYWIENNTRCYYNITFLDDNVTHAWLPASCVCSFLSPPRQRKHLNRKYSKYAKLIETAKEKAEAALTMPIKERLKKFSFAEQYSGKWPLAKDDDEDDNDKMTEDITKMLIKEIEDIESIKSSDSETDEAGLNHMQQLKGKHAASGNTRENSEEEISQNKMDEDMNKHGTSDYIEKNNTKSDGNKLDSKICPNTKLVPIIPKMKVISSPSSKASKIQPLMNVGATMKILPHDNNSTVKVTKITSTVWLEKSSFPQTNDGTKSFKRITGKSNSLKEATKLTPFMGKEINTPADSLKGENNKTGNASVVKKKLVNTKKKPQEKADEMDVKENEDKNIIEQNRKHGKKHETDEKTTEIKTQTSKVLEQKVKPSFKPPVKDNNGNNQCKENITEKGDSKTSDNMNIDISHSKVGQEENSLNKTKNIMHTKTKKESKQSAKGNKDKVYETAKSKSKKIQNNEVKSKNEILQVIEKNLNSSIKNNHYLNPEVKSVDLKAESNNSSETLRTRNKCQDVEVTKSVFEHCTINHKYDHENASNDKKVKTNIKEKKCITKRKFTPLTSSSSDMNESLKSSIANHSIARNAEAGNANGYKEIVDLTDLDESELKLPKNTDVEEKYFSLSLNLTANQSESEGSDPFEAE